MKQIRRLDQGIGKLGPRRADIHADYSEEDKKDDEPKTKLPPRRTYGYANRLTVSRNNRYFHNETRS